MTSPSASQRAPVEPHLLATDPEVFFAVVERRLADRGRGALAYVEIVGPHHEQALDLCLDVDAPGSDFAALSDMIGRALGPDDFFCWHGGRFVILMDRSGSAARSLGQVSRGIANREWASRGSLVHLTPIVAYLDLRAASSTRELWDLAERALQRAKGSLEIEPFRYVKRKEPAQRSGRPEKSPRPAWRTPQWLTLLFQLAISLLVGLGVPFIVYAICDALGADIAGPVYIGVVVVLVITATTIWIEGFLALKAPALPPKIGAPFPPATLIIPAYLPNEAETIMDTLRAFLRLEYADVVQIIVAYNSPAAHLPVEDEMQALAAEHAPQGRFLIEPVRVTGSTSKAQNVNAVIGRVRGRFVGIFDADHHPHADSLTRAWHWLSNGWDIVQGRCAIRNGSDSWIARMVAVEFEQIYAVSHPGRARFHGFGIFGGSNGFWRTSVLHETRMRHSMLTEDIDSSIRAVIAGYRITGDRDLVSEELAPTAMKQLLNQRLRWAQGWFQVSFRRVLPALFSPRVTVQQKLGLLHLLVWRELFPWYSIQVVPIMTYWVWVYGWSYITWTIPIFLITTIYTLSTGPGQILLAYHLAQQPMRRRPGWFFEYLFVSTFFYSPLKDTLSRIAHVKEAMGERAWKVTPRAAPGTARPGRLVPAAAAMAALLLAVVPGSDKAHAAAVGGRSPTEMIGILLGGEASTINAARTAARQSRNAEAARLFDKAIRDVPRRRGELLREYADALSYSNQSARAVPLYRELLSSTGDARQRRDIGARLAQALTWSRQYGAALAVYDDLLARTPNDRDLAVRRSRLLASIRPRNAAPAMAARQPDRPAPPRAPDPVATRAALAQASRNARNASVDAQVGMARTAARQDRNAEAAALFAAAIRTDPSRRLEILRENADQLSFSGRAADAIPLYAEVLNTALSASDRRQAMVGLANAYLWSGRLPDALAAYDRLLVAYPADVGLRWMRTVVAARQAAIASRNAEAAELFARAIALQPDRSGGILREYADQLSFTDRSALAVPLYQRALAQPGLTAADRLSTRQGLAQAHEWSGRLDLAKAAYGELLAQQPDDRATRWKLMVVSAHEAARADHNRAAAEFLAQAIRLDPARSGGILAEYADQLAFTGRSAAAIRFYRLAAGQPGLTATRRATIDRGLAQAYDWSGRYADARSAYAALLVADPDDIVLKWHLLVVSGREAAAGDRNRDAAQFLAQALRLMPARRMAILKEYADKLTYANQYRLAIPLYREALAQQLSGADARDTSLALALALSWDHRPELALREYERLADADPDDMEAALGMARSMSWAGRQSDAKLAYRRVLSAQPGNGEAQRGLAQAEDWDGRHREAQALLNRRLRDEPGDMEARRMLAQSLVWSGRPDDALAEVRRALELEHLPPPRRQPGTPRPATRLGAAAIAESPSATRATLRSSSLVDNGDR